MPIDYVFVNVEEWRKRKIEVERKKRRDVNVGEWRERDMKDLERKREREMWRDRKTKEREKHINRFKRESGMRVNDLEKI
jgi:hypothetical protein